MKKRITTGRIVAASLLSLLPLAFIGLGIFWLFEGCILNSAFFIGNFLFPALTLGLLLLLLFSEKKLWVKISLSILLLMLSFFSTLYCSLAGQGEFLRHYEKEEIAAPYAILEEAFPPLPDLSALGQTENIDYYKYQYAFDLFGTCHSDVLICSYGKEEYEKRKAAIEATYIFHKGQIETPYGSCEAETMLDTYHFRALAVSNTLENPQRYQRFMFIASNDSLQKLVYLTFDGPTGDISSLQDFLLEDCGWEHIN